MDSCIVLSKGRYFNTPDAVTYLKGCCKGCTIFKEKDKQCQDKNGVRHRIFIKTDKKPCWWDCDLWDRFSHLKNGEPLSLKLNGTPSAFLQKIKAPDFVSNLYQLSNPIIVSKCKMRKSCDDQINPQDIALNDGEYICKKCGSYL